MWPAMAALMSKCALVFFRDDTIYHASVTNNGKNQWVITASGNSVVG